jgi:hypothetical protein
MFNMKSTMSAVILAAGLVGIAPQVGAQSLNYHGTFTLPVEARFGNVVLQPGTYDIRTMEGAKGIRISGDRKEVTILAARAEAKDETEKNKMILVESNGGYALQSFESGSMAKSLRFFVGKSSRGTAERAAAAKQTIEVGMQ